MKTINPYRRIINPFLPGGSGWIIGVGLGWLDNSSTASGLANPGEGRPELQLKPLRLLFICPFASFHTRNFLLVLFFVYLSYFTILTVPIREYLGKCWLASFTFPIAILNGTCFLRVSFVETTQTNKRPKHYTKTGGRNISSSLKKRGNIPNGSVPP